MMMGLVMERLEPTEHAQDSTRINVLWDNGQIEWCYDAEAQAVVVPLTEDDTERTHCSDEEIFSNTPCNTATLMVY